MPHRQREVLTIERFLAVFAECSSSSQVFYLHLPLVNRGIVVWEPIGKLRLPRATLATGNWLATRIIDILLATVSTVAPDKHNQIILTKNGKFDIAWLDSGQSCSLGSGVNDLIKAAAAAASLPATCSSPSFGLRLLGSLRAVVDNFTLFALEDRRK